MKGKNVSGKFLWCRSIINRQKNGERESKEKCEFIALSRNIAVCHTIFYRPIYIMREKEKCLKGAMHINDHKGKITKE